MVCVAVVEPGLWSCFKFACIFAGQVCATLLAEGAITPMTAHTLRFRFATACGVIRYIVVGGLRSSDTDPTHQSAVAARAGACVSTVCVCVFVCRRCVCVVVVACTCLQVLVACVGVLAW